MQVLHRSGHQAKAACRLLGLRAEGRHVQVHYKSTRRSPRAHHHVQYSSPGVQVTSQWEGVHNMCTSPVSSTGRDVQVTTRGPHVCHQEGTTCISSGVTHIPSHHRQAGYTRGSPRPGHRGHQSHQSPLHNIRPCGDLAALSLNHEVTKQFTRSPGGHGRSHVDSTTH